MHFTSNVQQKLSSNKARRSDEFTAKCFVFKPERTPAVTLGYKERHCRNSTAMSWRGSWAQPNHVSAMSLYSGGRYSNSREVSIQSTAKEMIPTTKPIDAHAQDLVEKNQVLLSILKAFAQGTCSQRATRNAWCVQVLCTSRTGWWLPQIAVF
jgi:hypothetical protein